MPDNPDNPDQEAFFDSPDDESAAFGPPEPERIWPPADEDDVSEGEFPVDADLASDEDWLADTHDLDDAIGEIRQLNGGADEPPAPSADLVESGGADLDEGGELTDLEPPEPVSELDESPEPVFELDASDVAEDEDEIELDVSAESPEAAAEKVGAMVAGRAPAYGEGAGVEPPGEGLSGVEAEVGMVSDAEPAWAETGDSLAAAAAVWPPDDGVSPDKVGASVSVRVRDKSEGELSQLWGNVFFSAEHPSPRVVAVAPVRRGDGATQIATSLALLGAGSDKELRIALVDLNLRRSGIADVMGLKAEPGVKDVLEGSVSLEDAMQSVRLDNGNMLHVLAAGGESDHPLGLIRSRQMQAALVRLRERYDHVILDVSAADCHPDAQVIGRLVDGVLLVVSGGGTPRETAAEVKKRLELVGAVCLGLVLNQRSDPVPGLLYRMT